MKLVAEFTEQIAELIVPLKKIHKDKNLNINDIVLQFYINFRDKLKLP